MASQSYLVPKSNPNAQVSITFFLLWLVNALVLALANALFPQHVVLGTMSLSYHAALILSSGVLAWVATLAMPIFTEIEIRKHMVLSPHHWLIGYLVINVILLWIVARFAEAIGLGLSSWIYVLAVAAVLDFVQGMAMMAYGQLRQSKT